VPGVTPPIVDAATFLTVQRRLQDPERRSRGKRTHEYALSSWASCLRCGRAIVGQVLSQRFRYYRCRRSFAGPHHDRCDARYIRAEVLEQAVREEIAKVLANPQLIAAEYARQQAASEDSGEEAQRALRTLDEQKRRIVQLYKLGEIELAEYQAEAKQLKLRRAVIEQQLQQTERVRSTPTLVDLQQACEGVQRWVNQAVGDDLELLLEALQVKLRVEPGRAALEGVIPEYAPPCNDADVCPVVADGPYI
jgi:hypothetical protein